MVWLLLACVPTPPPPGLPEGSGTVAPDSAAPVPRADAPLGRAAGAGPDAPEVLARPGGLGLPGVPVACPEALLVPLDPYDPDAKPVAATPHAAVSGTEPFPRNLRVQWAGDPATTLALVWRTDVDTLASAVQIGTPEGGLSTVLGASFPLSGEAVDGRVHEVHVCGLSPGTTYTWRAGGEGSWSPEHAATTAPAPGSAGPFRFAVAGDSRDGYDTWASVLAGIEGQGVAFRMLTGDAVGRGDDVAQWNAWLDAGLGHEERIPTVMVNGNHESLAFPFLALNALPGDERTFSFDYADAHFIVLNDTVVSSGEWEAQSTWLAADLAATRQPWRFVFHHKPGFTASAHAEDIDVRNWFVPVEEAGGVTIDFAGHNHNYERSAPLLAGVEVGPTKGTTYVVTAGAGAPLYENMGDASYMKVGQSVNHYVVVSVDGPDRLELQAIDLAGNVIDRFTITR